MRRQTKTKTVLERDLRQILQDETRFPSGTVSFCEYGLGGDPGLPDSWIASGRGYWLPLELKRGPSVVKSLRPAQRLWHRTSLQLGNATYGATILMSGGSVRMFELTLDGRNLGERLLSELSCDSMQLHVLQQIIFNA